MDYQIYLTPEDLNALKRARSSDYTKYLGSHKVDSKGVIRFHSDLIEDFANRHIISVHVNSGGFECNNTVLVGDTWSCEKHE